MLYLIIRFIFRITNRFYFRTLHVKGLENIPKSGPVILVANHPSAFMDPIVIATVTERPLYFIAKGSLFQNRFTRWLLPKFNMIPVFRSNETPGQMHRNKDTFLHCQRHFEKGGALLIFPEGISLTERKIKKIQTGTARICLGAEACNNGLLDLKIVTVGLNFSNPHKFQSDLLVNIDAPITVSQYLAAYKENEVKAVHALTDEIRKRLETQVVAIQDSQTDKLVSNIELIYKSQLLKDLGYLPGEMIGDFSTTKAISDTVHYFSEHQPIRVARLSREIDAYLLDLERLSLNDGMIKYIRKSAFFTDAIRSVFYLLAGFPIFIFGFLNNYLPFKIPSWCAGMISGRPEFFGSISLSLGTLTFITFYTLQIALVNTLTQDWRVSISYAIALPVSGLFAFYYFRRFTTIRGTWKVFSLFYKRAGLVSSIIAKRTAIISALEKGKNDFIARMNGELRDGDSEINVGRDELNNFFSLNT